MRFEDIKLKVMRMLVKRNCCYKAKKQEACDIFDKIDDLECFCSNADGLDISKFFKDLEEIKKEHCGGKKQ